MLDFGEKKYKTYFPDSMLSNNKTLYRQTSRNLNSFLKNNFSQNSSKSKFPIKNSNLLNKTISLRKQISMKKKRPKSSEKHNLNSLIESLSHENYKSYNFYDNTRGHPLQSPKFRTAKSTILKSKINEDIDNTYSNNESNTKTNNMILFSSDSRPISSKNKYPNSNFSLYKINRKKVKNRKKELENNKKFFSFSDIFSRRNNISKNKSLPQTLISTRYKSNAKQNSIKAEYYSMSLNNSTKQFSKNRSTKSTISFQSYNRSKKNRKKTKFGDNYLSSKILNKSQIKHEKEQREFHQKLHLNNLYSQIKLFEVSNGFEVNEAQIKSNLISSTKFQRNLFIKEVKRASNHNDYFFKKFPFQSEKFEKIENKKKQLIHSPHQRLDNNSKKLIKNINKLDKKLNISLNLIKGLNIKSRSHSLNKLLDLVVPVKHNINDTNEEVKDETINYQKNMGKFFFYKGSGIYSGHLSSILRGDKIVRQVIKFNNL